MLSGGFWLRAGCLVVFGVGVASASPCVSSVAFSAGAVIGGGSVSGAVTLNTPAPSGGLTISLSSSNPNAQVAGQVTAQPGQTSVGFTVSTLPVVARNSAAITAAAGSCSANAGLTVQPAVLASLELSSTEARGNATLSGTVALSGPAPSAGAVVKLQASDPLVSAPASVSIPAGQTSATFPFTTGLSLSSNSVAITATYGESVQSALLSLQPGISMGPEMAGRR